MMTESKIEEAYVKLCAMREETPDASVSLALIGSHEIRMLADPEVVPDGTPLFWLELFDHSTNTSADSCCCRGFKDAVPLVYEFFELVDDLTRDLVPISPDNFDPLAVVVDWLDACRMRELDALLDLYDGSATLECNCEGVSLTGREAVAAYWAQRLERRIHSTFTLDDMILTDCGVLVDYRGHDGKAIRIHFHFSRSGRILHTSCGRRPAA
jgi:hypothetical protein